MNTDNKIQAFIKLLQDATSASIDLQKLLRQEMLLLASRKFEDLNEVLTKKMNIIDQLEEQDKKRSEFLSSVGYSADESGTKKFLSDNNDQKLTLAWQELMVIIKECQVINQSNGMVVSKNQTHIKQAMNIITGGNNSSTNDTYNKKGIQSYNSSRRDISKA